MSEHQTEDESDTTLSSPLSSENSDYQKKVNFLQEEMRSKNDECKKLVIENGALKSEIEAYKLTQESMYSELLRAMDRNKNLSSELANIKQLLLKEKKDVGTVRGTCVDHSDAEERHNDSDSKMSLIAEPNISGVSTKISREKMFMKALFSNRKESKIDNQKHDDLLKTEEVEPTSVITPTMNTMRSVEDPRIKEIKDKLDKEDIQQILRPIEDPLVTEARRKHPCFDTSIGAVSSIGFKPIQSNTIIAPSIPLSNSFLPDEGRGDSDPNEIDELMTMARDYAKIETTSSALEDDEDAALFARVHALKVCGTHRP
eukprot:Tbor_TRINITY_DN5399_c2_g3::TRINITY_DN5399_c2_g3_i1::g.4398::m.4398